MGTIGKIGTIGGKMTSKVILGTNYVLADEDCMGLYEVHEQSPGSRGFHRYQIVHVNRGDKLAEYREDLGSAKKFKGVDSIFIPGGTKGDDGRFHPVHTVGELKDIADEYRCKRHFDKAELAGVNKIKEG